MVFPGKKVAQLVRLQYRLRQMRVILRHLTPTRAILAIAAILAGTAAISPATLVNLFARSQPHRLISDLAYGDGARRRADVYLPRNQTRPAPIVIYLYGGSWNNGAKEIYRFIGASFAAQGVVTVVPNYSLFPQARFPTFLEDAALALRWTRDNALRFGANPEHMFLMGHSAGGHIAAMLAFDRRWLDAVGLSPARDIAGVIGLAGAYDFAIDTDLLRGVFGPPANAAETQPLRHVTADAPPLLLLTGESDKTVKPRNTRALAERVRAIGGEVHDIYYPGVGHIEIIGAFSPLFRFLAPVMTDVEDFIAMSGAPARRGAERKR